MDMQVIKNLFRGYRGGPNFGSMQQHDYSIGNYKLSIMIPSSYPALPASPKIINFPLDDEGWFERHSEQTWHRFFISVIDEFWYFLPLIPMPFRGELGMLIFNISIQKVPQDSSKNIFQPNELGEYLLDEYMSYYNASGDDNNPIGWNTEIRNKMKKQSSEMCRPFSPTELEENIQLRLRKYGYPDIKEYSVVSYSQRDWVFHQYKKTGTHQHYSLALTEDYYLTVSFQFITNISSENTFWYKDAVKASQKIMENIRIKEDVLISHANN